MSPLFYLFAALTLGGAFAAMSLRHPVHCVLFLVFTFVGLAGVYLALGAQFLGLAQVLIYVGAVAILVMFVLLLTRSGDTKPPPVWCESWRSGLLLGALTAGVLIAVVLAEPGLTRRDAPPALPSVQETGQALMTEFVLPLQVVGLLLTVAMVGASVLALKERQGTRLRRGPSDP